MSAPINPLVFVHFDFSIKGQSQTSTVRSHTAKHTWEKRRRLRTLVPSIRQPAKARSRQIECKDVSKSSTLLLRPFRGNSDPFSVAALEITPLTHELLSLSHRWPLFQDYPIWATEIYEERVREAQSVIMQNVLGDQAMLHCLLAAGCYVKFQINKVASIAALWHKTRALEIMQLRLSKGADVSMLIDYLVPLEYHVGNLKAAEIHWRALQRILETNTTSDLHNSMLPHLWIQDIWLAYYLGRKTILDIDLWDKPLPISNEWCFNVSCNVFWMVDNYLLDMAADIRQFVALRRLAMSLKGSSERDELVHWLHLHNAAIDGRLNNHFIDLGDVENTALPSQALNATVTLALMCFTHLMWFNHPYADIQKTKHSHFDSLLQRAGSDIDKDLLLWLYFMCALNDSLLPSPTGWAKNKFESLRVRHCDWEETRSVLDRFLYLEGLEKQLTRVAKTRFTGVYFLYQKLWLAEWDTE